MKTHYKQLTLDDRENLFVYKAQGLSLRSIAKKLAKSHSSISRELKRNNAHLTFKLYQPYRAHEKAQKRKQRPSYSCIKNDYLLRRYIYSHLQQGWSPEIISGRLPLDFADRAISHETIYRFIYSHDHALIPFLARRHKRRRKRAFPRNPQKFPPIPFRVSIDQRPDSINKRSQFGHWEADSMVCRSHSTSLHALVERKSRFLKLSKIPANNSSFVSNTILARLAHHPTFARRSITYDNGPENYRHHLVNDSLHSLSFFCYPYHAWQKGSVENTIGLVRRFIPKRSNLQRISSSQVKSIEYLLNSRPRKCLNFKTPAELFRQGLGGALEM